MTRTIALLLAFAGTAGIGGCSPPAAVESRPVPEVAAPAVAVAEQPVQTDQAAYRGAAVAGQVCSRCHDVGMGAPPTMEIGAPKFRDIAGRADSTADGLAAKMRDSHPAMPDFIFEEPEIADLAAYILSLPRDPA